MPSVLRPSALARPGPAGRALSGTRGQGRSHAPRGDLTALDTELGNAGGAPSHHGRFLKPCEGTPGAMRPGPRPGSAVRAGSAPGSAAHTRLSAVLSKVAQLESKIMGQKKRLELHNTDSGLGCASSASGREGGAKGRRYWKNSGATGGNGTRRDACSGEEESTPSPERSVVVKQQLDLDSDEEEMRELMESSLGLSSGSGNQKVLSKTPAPSGKAPPPRKEISSAELSTASSSHNKDSEESVSGRVNSPAPSPTSRNLSGHPTRPRLLSSSMQDSTAKSALPKAGYTKQIQESLESVRSEIKSLDELFSEGTDAEAPSSSSLKYFGLNIMSLDDLAPDTTSKAAELKQKGEDIPFTQESNKYVKKDALQVEEEQAAVKMSSAITAGSDSSAEEVEKCVSEAEISEHLSGVSSDFPPHKQHYLNQNESTLNSEYSEDFEGSQSAAEGEEGRAEGCSCSGAHPSSGPPPEQHSPGHQVSVTEAAVQTAEPPFSSCWAKAHPAAALAPPVGTSCIDPVPIASHAISPDAVEALSAYSPSALLLHTLCKQHLMLTQHFVQNVHHLHTALVESLEREKFCYHTLEEAKEYIRNHKSPPLTIEQALEEIQREPRRNCLDSYCTSSDICIHRAKAERRNLPSCTDKR